MRRSYDKQFKIAAVKLVLDDDMPVSEAAKALTSTTTLYTVGSVNMKNTERVHSQVMGLHSIPVSMRLKSLNMRMKNSKRN
jgi:hypothetical protein